MVWEDDRRIGYMMGGMGGGEGAERAGGERSADAVAAVTAAAVAADTSPPSVPHTPLHTRPQYPTSQAPFPILPTLPYLTNTTAHPTPYP
eukprot:2374501-Rhodomonas_salina.1